mmetsp:Transcript_6964/g.9260  ORF Transcript_6964/g.9260 Transcript_6964/m.9260 type:complete len:129 (-) Transcript_6964:893-1279(-)
MTTKMRTQHLTNESILINDVNGVNEMSFQQYQIKRGNKHSKQPCKDKDTRVSKCKNMEKFVLYQLTPQASVLVAKWNVSLLVRPYLSLLQMQMERVRIFCSVQQSISKIRISAPFLAKEGSVLYVWRQ